jgi:integrase
LFPELQRNERGHIGGGPSRFWRDYLSRVGLKKGGDGLGAHSFRHTMADQLRLAGYLDDEIEVALGHNQKSVTSGYGRLKQGTVERLSRMFEAVKFDGVCVDALVEERYKSNQEEEALVVWKAG